MKKLDFNPHKTKEAFRNNYKLHDLAEAHGKNLLIQWGVRFGEFGKDKRYERVWEKGKDKPDILIEYKNKKALLDWKGKHKSVWLVNKRAFDSYRLWKEKLGLPVFICFSVFGSDNLLKEIRFTVIDTHSYILSSTKEWDKNTTVEFEMDIPQFTKPNLLKYLKI